MKRIGSFLVFLTVALQSGGVLYAKDVLLREGIWVELKGEFVDGIFVAGQVTVLEEPDLSIKGPIDEFDPETGEIRFGPLTLRLDSNSRIRNEADQEIGAEQLRSGQSAKVSLEDDEGSLEIRRIRLLPKDSSGRLRLEGPIQTVLLGDLGTNFMLLGVEVRTTKSTGWTGIIQPRAQTDDDDDRPGDGLRLGKPGRLGRLAGELRLDYISEANYDLFDDLDTDISTGRGSATLEWVFPATRRMSGMLQLKLFQEEAITDDADAFSDMGDADLRLGKAYLLFNGLLGKHGSLMVGRSRFDDDRDWLYNRDLDAVRVFFDFARFRFEGAVFQELVDPEERQEDILNTLVRATYFPAKRHSASAYILDRNDSFEDESGSKRDFSPRLFGVQAEGKFKRLGLEYWLEAARSRGEDDGVALRGEAFDVGLTYVAPLRFEPSVTIGYAFGSGDTDSFDDVDENFRQSELHGNKGKWNGVTSFKYYGELFRTDLSNLHIETYGLGFLPLSDTSIDLIYHRYELDQVASELLDADVGDRNLNLTDLGVGTEWDLILGFEQLKHFEFELDLAYFEPGDAFLGPTDPAEMIRFKAKYKF